MVKNIFLEVEYVGTNYFGFQVQDKKNTKEITVQSVLEDALKRLFNKKIRIIYSSRTDRGVHARGQAVNFKVVTNIPLVNIKNALNTFLPKDVRVKKVKEVSLDFHSRFSAKSKIYRYVILNRKEYSVFWADFAWHVDRILDIPLMRKVSKEIIGKKDFSLFAKFAHEYSNCQRTIKKITITRKSNFVCIDIEADGFLRNMARNIVSFLVGCGYGKINVNNVANILSRKIKYHNDPAPGAGLYLIKVKYPNNKMRQTASLASSSRDVASFGSIGLLGNIRRGFK